MLLGPILGPVFMAMKVDATYKIPDVFGTIALDCGSVFSPKDEPEITDAVSWDTASVPDTPALRSDLRDECDSAISGRKRLSIGIIVVGGLIWIVAAVAFMRTKKNPVTLSREWLARQTTSN